MIRALYLKLPRRIWLIILFVVIILVVYFALRFVGTATRNTPEEFLQARQEASLIAADIVTISDNSISDFDQIAKLDSQGDYTNALLLVTKELENNQVARKKAITLSDQLAIMAKNLDKISPTSAGQIALQAVSSETELISRLINYNDGLNQLLGILREKFLGKASGDKILELLSKINDEVKAINDLNRQFNDLMSQFDVK